MRGHSIPDGFSRALVVVFSDNGLPCAVAGLERRCVDLPFSRKDMVPVRMLAPQLVLGATVTSSDAGSKREAFRAARPEDEVGPGEPGAVRTAPNPAPGREMAAKLSAREREVAELLAAGYSHVNIGARQDLSPHTVRTYIRRIYAKLAVANRADLVRAMLGESGAP